MCDKESVKEQGVQSINWVEESVNIILVMGFVVQASPAVPLGSG